MNGKILKLKDKTKIPQKLVQLPRPFLMGGLLHLH